MTSALTSVDSLDQLQTPEQVQLLDAIDNLRNQGVGHYNISLPQLIVCGDQSSGKSSVLEGLTRLRFPTKDGLCTTFATELVLRKHPIVEITCTIVPGRGRSQTEKGELSKFKHCFPSREAFSFPRLLEDAKKRMAFGAQGKSGPFFEDILQIKYSGPDLPSLTIVDLPGIIQSHVDGQRGVNTVRELVQGYMADERSIILAVVAARYDHEIQSVLEYVREFDPSASRTLGIITKPDDLNVGSDSERDFIQLARNEKMTLDLGWHAVKNRGYGNSDQSDAARDESERQFFATGAWSSLPKANVGIDALRAKLSRVLLQHIRKELPSLSTAIQDAITMTEASLKALGDPRDEQQQQRNFLMTKASRFQKLTDDALRGLYEDPFFDLSSFDSIPPTRLRTEIQELNIAFANTMYHKGHVYQISDDQSPFNAGFQSLSTSETQCYDDIQNPSKINRTEFLKRIATKVRTSRQAGLPSIVNPGVLGEVFREQSKPWEHIARRHLREVFDAVQAYIYDCLNSIMDVETFNSLMHEHIEHELEKRKERLDDKLNELLLQFQNQKPILYDPSFFYDLEQMRVKRYAGSMNKSALGTRQRGTTTQFLTDFTDDFTNCEIMDLVNTYYSKVITVFISNVTVLAIENCLISELPSLLSPDLVLNMDEEKLRNIALESEETRTERAALTQKFHDLRGGKRVLDSQARRTGKAMRQRAPPQRPTRIQSTPRAPAPDAPTPDAPTPRVFRPSTPEAQSAPSLPEVQIDNLTSGINNLNVTPPPSNTQVRSVQRPKVAPLTPPKTPKPPPEPRSLWSAHVDDDSDDEL